MQAAFPGVEFLRILFRFKKMKKIRRRISMSSIKRQIILRGSRRSRAVDVKEMY